MMTAEQRVEALVKAYEEAERKCTSLRSAPHVKIHTIKNAVGNFSKFVPAIEKGKRQYLYFIAYMTWVAEDILSAEEVLSRLDGLRRLEALYRLGEALRSMEGLKRGSERLSMAVRIAFNLYRHFEFGPRMKDNTVAVIDGPPGAGKTTYAFWSVYGALRLLGVRDETAMAAAKASLLTRLEQLAELVDLTPGDVWLPAVILDDAGVHASKYWMWKEREARRSFISLFEALQVTRNLAAAVLITTPTVKDVAKALRNISFLLVHGERVELSRFSTRDVYLVKWVTYRRVVKDYSKSLMAPPTVVERLVPITADVTLAPLVKLPDDVADWNEREKLVALRGRLAHVATEG